jgi:hypothetical protein
MSMSPWTGMVVCLPLYDARTWPPLPRPRMMSTPLRLSFRMSSRPFISLIVGHLRPFLKGSGDSGRLRTW